MGGLGDRERTGQARGRGRLLGVRVGIVVRARSGSWGLCRSEHGNQEPQVKGSKGHQEPDVEGFGDRQNLTKTAFD